MRVNSNKTDVQSKGKELSDVIDFDVYFRKVMHKNPKVQKHHATPMRHFAASKGLLQATEEQFDELFRSY